MFYPVEYRNDKRAERASYYNTWNNSLINDDCPSDYLSSLSKGLDKFILVCRENAAYEKSFF